MRMLPQIPRLSWFVAALLFVCAHAATAADVSEVNRLHRSGDSAQALQLADKLLLANPKDAQLLFLKGVVLAETLRNADAIEVFRKMTEDFPELPEPYNNLAAQHAAMGEYEMARLALEQAIRNNAAYATAHENLGDVYAMLASRAYARANALEPASATLSAKLRLVRELFSAKVSAAPARPAP